MPSNADIAREVRRSYGMTDPVDGTHAMAVIEPPKFVVKDSGKRHQFDSGMQRDTEEGKIDYTLVFDGPMLERWAAHLTKGAKKYEARNWLRAAGTAEMERFRRSAVRHFFQWLRGDSDEDHLAATWFNTNGYEYVKAKMDALVSEG